LTRAASQPLLSGGWLSPKAWARLQLRARHAAARTATGRRTIVSVSERLAGEHDPTAIVLTSRRPDDRFSVFEQPTRDRRVLAGLGCALEITGAGPGRFQELEREWRALAQHAQVDAADGPAGSGLAVSLGFAFGPGPDSNSGSDPGSVSGSGEGTAGGEDWEGFPNSSLIVPAVALARAGHETWLTVNLAVPGKASVEGLLEQARVRLDSLRDTELAGEGDDRGVAPSAVTAALPVTAPPDQAAATGAGPIITPQSPQHYLDAVAEAVRRIRAGQLEKVVLARQLRVRAAAPYEPATILSALRERFPECFVYAAGRGDASFLGATPELLIRRDGQRASTVALAGSIRRGEDPAVDEQLGRELLASTKNVRENQIVARRIAEALAPLSVWVTRAAQPELVRVANIQHHCTPVRAQLAADVGLLRIASVLHPTPAVGGEPGDVAAAMIPELEGFNRGWYAGTVGWMDVAGDGELCVALRGAVLHGACASCYAGCGIVADSDPAAELAETETKLGAILPVLTGAQAAAPASSSRSEL
jgi:salicylate biosynthesis isochorismate synthase/menaquinone-specific isochorismate synthase